MQIGPYLVQHELGRGGMGVVYQVVAPDGRAYALKRLSAESSSDDVVRRRRIGRELEALRRIDHPGVVRALDSGWHGNAFFIVMELIQGPTLGQLLQQRGPIPPQEAAALCAIVARTLHDLHEQGIAHRDVKPDNIMIDKGYPRLTDLGLVQLDDDDARLTKTGTTLGTPGYCAPELLSIQRSSAGSSPAADVYGLGATLYALLTGRPPFEGDSQVEIAVQTVDRPATPPSQELRGLTSAEVKEVARLDAVCLRCLAKAPGDRYASALDLALDLESALEDEPSEGGVSLKLVLAGLIPLLLLTLGAAVVLSGSSPTPSTPPSASPVTAPTVSVRPTISPTAPSPAPSAPPWRSEVVGVDDLAPLGRLAPIVWKGRGGEWTFGRTQDGFVTLHSERGGASMQHFFLMNQTAGTRRLETSVEVKVDPVAEGDAAAGLLYGRPDKKCYVLLGLTSKGRYFLRVRTPGSMQDRLSGHAPGLRRFGFRETRQGLVVSIDGRQRMVLGAGVLPQAAAGVFVATGVGRFRKFTAEWR